MTTQEYDVFDGMSMADWHRENHWNDGPVDDRPRCYCCDELLGDRYYLIMKQKHCRECALEWFDDEFLRFEDEI